MTKGTRFGADKKSLLTTERIFCAEFLANGCNSSAAAAVAYPTAANPASVASSVMRRPRVKKYLAKMLYSRVEEAGLTTQKVLEQLAHALTLDPLDCFEPVPGLGGVYRIKDLEDIPPHVRRCITKLRSRFNEDTGDLEVLVEFMSKDKMMELAMKYLGLLKDGGINVNIQQNRVHVDYDRLYKGEDVTDEEPDEIEGRIAYETKGD